MLVIQVLILAALLLVIPFFVGGIFSVVESGRGRRMFQWISGQFLIWVGIELIAVALIIKREELHKAMLLFWWYIAAVICFALGTLICQKVRGKKFYADVRKRSPKSSGIFKELWCLFFCLLLLQVIWIVWDFDVTAIAEETTPFYVTSPFTMWIAFLAESSGMRPELVEQVALPIVFLCMSYGVFYLLGAKLLKSKREYQPLLLVILSVLALVGKYVCKKYWAEFWPFAMSKAEVMMLGFVLLPYFVFLLLLFWEILYKKKNT